MNKGPVLEITYIGHRGGVGYENLFPEKHYISFGDLRVGDFAQAVHLVMTGGFHRTYKNSGVKVYIPPTAIIEFKEYQK